MSGHAVTPLAQQLDDLLTCVHCGFCLPACPTYEVLGDENDSPRGRLYLMRAVAERRLEAGDGSFALHVDRCLGCRACEPVCPSGVRYGGLLEQAREARVAAGGVGNRLTRLSLRLAFATRWLQNALWFALKVLRATRLPLLVARAGRAGAPAGRFRFAMAMLAATSPRSPVGLRATGLRSARGSIPSRPAPAGEGPAAGERVALLEGCVMSGLYRHVNRATERVVAACGGRPVALPGGFCCGALHAHAGMRTKALELARGLIGVFELSGAEVLVTNSAGCGAALKEYVDWFRDEPGYAERAERLAGAVLDATEWLAERAGPDHGRLDARIGYDAPCHLLHAQRIDEAPIAALSRIPGLEVVPLARADRCCGAAGTYGLTRRRLSDELLKLKLSEILESGVEWVTTGNPGCLMQIGAGALIRGADTPVVHPLELLDVTLAAQAAG